MARKGGRSRGRRNGRGELVKVMGPGGSTKVELSRTGSRDTKAPMASLVDAVQGMTRGALTDQAPAYEPTRNLPRDPLDTSPFGPLAPLFINAINPPRVDTGRPEPRVWEYPQGFNLPGGGDRLIPWETLRAASTNVDIIRRCIEIRKDDVRDLKTVWRISDKAVKAAQEADPGRPRDEIEADLRKRFAADIERLTAFWERPWITNGVRFGQWVAAVMEDHIALDAVAIYPITTFGGDVIGFRVVDGSTIKLLINDLGERPQPPFPAFQQVVNGFPRGEFIADVVLSEDGAEITDSTMFSASQITYWRENFRTYTPYGYSQVEQALVSAALYLKRQGWMHSEYDEGSTPLTWLVPQSDKFTANQLDPVKRREYEQAINDDLEGQTGKRHRIKISYPGFEPTQMDSVDERYKPEYDLFLLKLVSSHLGVTLDRLGFTEAKGLGATGQHERQAEVQDDSGVNPDAAMLQDLIMELSRNYLECPAELCFEFTKDKAEDEKAKDEINAARRSRGAITLNEDRKSLGLTPLSIEEADMPSMATATGMVYIEGGAQKQALMDEAAVKLAQNPPAPGMSGASGGRPGGTGGGTGAGGSAPKPSGPKSTGPSKPANPPQNKAAGPEIVAYHRWLRKQAGRIPARPFRFEAAQPDDLAIAGAQLDGRFQAFDGYEWRQDITKDWRSWNAQHPLHPRGPHGRFVKVGNLVDELRRTQGELSEHHENAFDEAVRRAHAGRHIRRGESQLADDLESRGFLEELGGAGNDRGRLSVSEAGRRHLQARWDEPDSEPAVPDPIPPDRTPTGAPEPIAELQAKRDAARSERLAARKPKPIESAGAASESQGAAGSPGAPLVGAAAVRANTTAELSDVRARLAVSTDARERERLEFRMENLERDLREMDAQAARTRAADLDREGSVARIAASTPKALDISASGGQVDTSPSTVEGMTTISQAKPPGGKLSRPQVEMLRKLHEGEDVRWTHGTRDALISRGLLDSEWVTDERGYRSSRLVLTPAGREAIGIRASEVVEGEIEGDLPTREMTIPVGRGGRAKLADAGKTRASEPARPLKGMAEWTDSNGETTRGEILSYNSATAQVRWERSSRTEPVNLKDPSVRFGDMPDRPTGLLNDDFSVNPEKVHAALLDASSREEAAALIDRLGLKVPELRQLARDMNIPVHSGAKKSDIRDTIVSLTAGRRLDSLAINPGNRPAGTVSASKAPVESGAARQLRIQIESYQTLLARAEELDIQINFADSDRERRSLEGQRESLDQQLAALDRQIEAARKRVPREARKT